MKEFPLSKKHIFNKNKFIFISLIILLSLNYSSSFGNLNENRNLDECYPNCKNCTESSTAPHNMKCLTCQDGFNFYKKSNNCLNCSKYVNYEQTECIDEIPEGYYLENPELGILEKCHELCKTCDGPPVPWGMQCIECKYEDEDFKPTYETDCPDEPDDDDETDIPAGECPRTEPILVRDDICFMTYCTDEEYESGLCKINNEIIKMQWINRIQRFGDGEINNACLDYGENGELMLFGQQKDENNNTWIYIYGIDKSFSPFFNDDISGKYSYFKKVLLPYDITLENIKIVKNFENDNLFLISTQINNEMYVFDYNDNSTKIHKFERKAYSTKSSDIINIKKMPEVYFTNFIICHNDNEKECYGFIRKFKFTTNDNDIALIKEFTTKTKINLKMDFICIESFPNYIQCLYLESETNKFKLSLYDINTHLEKHKFEIEPDLNYTSIYFNSMLKLNDKAFVVVYLLDNNIIKVLVKSVDYNYYTFYLDLFDYVENVPYIILNSNKAYKFYDNDTPQRNSLCKINDNKFAILLNSFNGLDKNINDNSEIVIYIFSIFNKNRNINVRKYSINFRLYNMVNKGKLLGYTIGNYFGILLDLSLPGNKNITNAGFITFGYVGIKDDYDYVVYEKDFFPENSTLSNPLSVRKYLSNKVQNNLFGYSFNDAIILSLPKEKMGVFYFGQHYKISEHQSFKLTEDIYYELYDNYTGGNYSIEFAGAAQEPIYNDVDKYAEEVYYYPNNTNVSEKYHYNPKMLIGQKIKFIFNIKDNPHKMDCYPSCSKCDYNSSDDNNHMCTECKYGYYFLNGTKNCYKDLKEHYYFDKNEKKYYPCYKDCLTCDKKETSIHNMNCLSCDDNFDFYPKSKNCLDCPNYVSYTQEQCISSIPEGYYLLDEALGTIDKCYQFCKTCSKGPTTDTSLHMNCDICLYENKNFVPKENGDCPDTEDVDDEVDPVDGVCPRDKPILKKNKCKMIYCTEKEFEDKICIINNDYIKTQWLNKINNFPENAIKIKYDENDNGDIFLISQKKESEKINMLVYGFNKEKEGYFYDKIKDEYNSFKEISFNNKEYIEKIKYLEFDKKDYFLNMIQDNKSYLIDFNSTESFTISSPYIPIYIDKFEKNIEQNNEYLYDYIYCDKNENNENDKCYLGITKYKINNKNDISIITNIEEKIMIKPNTKLICINNVYSSNFILCKYNQYQIIDKNSFINKHIISLFDSDTLYSIDENILDDYFMPGKQTFDAIMPIDDSKSNFIIAYSTSQNIIKVLFKKLKEDYTSIDDLIPNIPCIYINEDLKYNFYGDVFSNDMAKLNEDNFVLLIKTYKINNNKEQINNGLLVVSLRIDKLSMITLRYYEIDFTLYNMNIKGSLIGYNLGGLFGVLLEINSNSNEIGNSAFLTFGFMNATKDVSLDEGTKNLITEKKNIKIKDYMGDIENNLFGYEVVGVQIQDLPDAYKVGGFLNLNDGNKLINKNDIISIQSELRFKQVNSPIYGRYFISFISIIKESSEEITSKFAIKTEYYPDNSTKAYFNPRTFKGKLFKYNFAISEPVIKCFPNCEECFLSSEDINNQHCLSCKKGFYFIDNTRNCFDKIDSKYYFDEKTKKFYPCYKDCYTCKEKEINSSYMNCESCSSEFNYYSKSKNCLNCNKYVNYEQTQCIYSIPEGYYLQDPKLGIIDKCYELCKTCSQKEIEKDGIIHMNCDTCVFTNNTKITIKGNCPEKEEREDAKTDEKKDESPDKTDDNGSNWAMYFGIGVGVLVIIVICGIIFYKLCLKKNKNKNKIDPSIYFNTNEKSIPFEDDNEDAIN